MLKKISTTAFISIAVIVTLAAPFYAHGAICTCANNDRNGALNTETECTDWCTSLGSTVASNGWNSSGKMVEIKNILKAQTLVELADQIATWLVLISIPITVIVIIWAGVLFITAGGNKDKIETGRKALMWAVIGFAIVLIAKGATSVIKSFLGVETSGSTSIQRQINIAQKYIKNDES